MLAKELSLKLWLEASAIQKLYNSVFYLYPPFILIFFAMQQLNQQEDLLVWMRTAALPNFRKLYGRIETDLEANEIIKVEIQNNYNTYSFNGKKKLVISTTNWIGGKNDFLGKVYMTVGGVCLFIAIAFIIVYLIKPR